MERFPLETSFRLAMKVQRLEFQSALITRRFKTNHITLYDLKRHVYSVLRDAGWRVFIQSTEDGYVIHPRIQSLVDRIRNALCECYAFDVAELISQRDRSWNIKH